MVYSTALRMTTGDQSGPGRTANRMRIGLGKAYPRLGKLINIGGQQVIRSIAPCIERALIIGEKNDYVGLGPERAGRKASAK